MRKKNKYTFFIKTLFQNKTFHVFYFHLMQENEQQKTRYFWASKMRKLSKLVSCFIIIYLLSILLILLSFNNIEIIYNSVWGVKTRFYGTHIIKYYFIVIIIYIYMYTLYIYINIFPKLPLDKLHICEYGIQLDMLLNKVIYFIYIIIIIFKYIVYLSNI